MPQFNLTKAFALTDNPFSPNMPLPGMANPLLINSIVAGPLRIHEDAALENLYCPRAGPFERHFNDFRDLIASRNYFDAPPQVGMQPFAFFIRGPRGSGKTTLANRMIAHLRQCRPAGATLSWWKILDDWSDREFTAESQRQALGAIDKDLQGRPATDYCCLLLDNLVAGLEVEAINLFSQLSRRRVVFLFLVSSDEKLLARGEWDNFYVPVTPFQTEELRTYQAVRYIRQRLKLYRSKDATGSPLLPVCPMFPFDPYDIRDAVAKQGGKGGREIVTLRELNSHLARALLQRMQKLPGTYDIATFPPAQYRSELIRISDRSYERMVA